MWTNDDISKQGYKYNSPYRNSSQLVISSPKGKITMDGVNKALLVKDVEYGDTRVLQPNSGVHSFRGKTMVEMPINNITGKDSWQMKIGGNFMNYGDGKLLPYLRQDGGTVRQVYESRRPSAVVAKVEEFPLGKKMEVTSVSVDDNSNGDAIDFDSKMEEMMSDEGFNSLPAQIKDELEFFRDDAEQRSKLTKEYVQKYMPEVYAHCLLPKGNSNAPEPSKHIEQVRYEEPIGLEEFETREEPKMQYGGHKYDTGMRIQYRSGGQIKEGVIKSYNPTTNKIELY